MRNDKAECRKRRLQNGGEARWNSLLAPKYEPVIKTELQEPNDCDYQPVGTLSRPTYTARQNQEHEDCRSEQKTNARKRQRRQIRQTQLDEEPGRAPDATEDQPNNASFHSHEPQNTKRGSSPAVREG